MENDVLLDRAIKQVSAGTGSPYSYVFAAMRFRTGGNRGFLQVILETLVGLRLGSDAQMSSQIGAGLSDDLVLSWGVRISLGSFWLIGTGANVAGSNCVSERCIRFPHYIGHKRSGGLAAIVVAGNETDNRVSAGGISSHGEDVAVIGGGYDQRFSRVCILVGRFDRLGKFGSVSKGAIGVTSVMSVIYSPPSTRRKKPFELLSRMSMASSVISESVGSVRLPLSRSAVYCMWEFSNRPKR